MFSHVFYFFIYLDACLPHCLPNPKTFFFPHPLIASSLSFYFIFSFIFLHTKLLPTLSLSLSLSLHFPLHTAHESLPLSPLCPKMGCASGYCGGSFMSCCYEFFFFGWLWVWRLVVVVFQVDVVCVCVCVYFFFLDVVVGWILWVAMVEFYGFRWLWVRQLVVVGLILWIWSPPLIWFDLHRWIGKKLFGGKIVVLVGKRVVGFLS